MHASEADGCSTASAKTLEQQSASMHERVSVFQVALGGAAPAASGPVIRAPAIKSPQLVARTPQRPVAAAPKAQPAPQSQQNAPAGETKTGS